MKIFNTRTPDAINVENAETSFGVVKPRSVLIFGGGAVTGAYYLPAIEALGWSASTTVVESNASNLRELEKKFPLVTFEQSEFQNFFSSSTSVAPSDNGMAIVALPNHLHVDASRAALAAGFHVLCEKPLSNSPDECANLRSLAVRQRRLLKVAMSRRYLPSWKVARDIYVSGQLGAVQSVSVRDCGPFLWQPKSFDFFAPSAGGVLADMGTHYLDYLRVLLGLLEPVAYLDDSRGGNESSLKYELRAGPVKVELELSRLDSAGAFIEMACERGTIVIQKANENEVLVTRRDGRRWRAALDPPFPDPAWPADFCGSFCELLYNFTGSMQGKACEIADAADAEAVSSLIAWAYKSRIETFGPKHPPRVSKALSRVLVTGATGFIGGHLLERLSGTDANVRVTARSPGACANVARYPVEIVPTDLLDRRQVKAAVARMRTVYHLAYGRDGSHADAVTIEGTKNVVEAAIEEGAESVVVLSTMNVFGLPNAADYVDESFPYDPYGGEYGRSKATMERWCLRRAREAPDTRIVVLNPTCVFGPSGGAYTTLPVKLARQRQFCWVEGGGGICNYTYVTNLVDALLQAATVPEAAGERFIINDGNTSWKRFLGPLVAPLADEFPSYSAGELKSLRRFGPPFALRELFAGAIRAQEVRDVLKRSAYARAVFSAWRQSSWSNAKESVTPVSRVGADPVSSIPPEWIGTLYGPTTSKFSSEKARRVLHWTSRVGFETAQDETLRWLRDAGHLPSPRNEPQSSFAQHHVDVLQANQFESR